MQLSDFSKSPPYYCSYEIEIKENTTRKQFKKKIDAHKEFAFDKALYCGNGDAPLNAAALVGNLKLIKYIFSNGGPDLLYIENLKGETPLHCAIKCKNEKKGYFAAKKLLKLGTPVNIVRMYEKSFSGKVTTCFSPTPLETALSLKKIRIATLLLRLNGFARVTPLLERTFDIAKQNLMNDNELIFYFQDILPYDVLRLIFIYSTQLSVY